MNLKINWKCTIVTLVISLYSTFLAAGSGGVGQTHFSAEDSEVQRPLRIPSSILNCLVHDPMVGKALEDENIAPERIPDSWFQASEVRLSNFRKVDVIVVGRGPLAGSNLATFWAFSSARSGYKLLFNGAGHDLFLKTKLWNGYREIELVSMTSKQVIRSRYRYNGSKYQKFSSQTEVIQ